MGLCGSKNAAKGATATGDAAPVPNNPLTGMMDNLKGVIMSVVVEQAFGGSNDSQFDFVKTAIAQVAPKSTVQQQLVPGADSNLFNVLVDGQKVHSSQTDGPVQNNPGFMDKIKNIALSKLSQNLV